METEPTRMCALLVGLPDVTVLSVAEWPGWLRIVIARRVPRPSCCGLAARWALGRVIIALDEAGLRSRRGQVALEQLGLETRVDSELQPGFRWIELAPPGGVGRPSRLSPLAPSSPLGSTRLYDWQRRMPAPLIEPFASLASTPASSSTGRRHH